MENRIIWTFDNLDLEKRVIGPLNQTLNLISTELNIELSHKPNHLILNSGDSKLIESLMKVLSKDNNVTFAIEENEKLDKDSIYKKDVNIDEYDYVNNEEHAKKILEMIEDKLKEIRG